MKKSFLVLDSTKKMYGEGFNAATLSLIENRHLQNAYIALKALPNQDKPNGLDEILRHANESIPKGDHLYREYVKSRSSKSDFSIEELKATAKRLTMSASRLEGDAVKILAANGSVTLAQSATMQHMIGERYAQLIEAAKELEESGVIASHQSASLDALTQEPAGPLKEFYPKALAIVHEREGEQLHSYARQR